MQYHASLITADGAYHCPVGSIMAIFENTLIHRYGSITSLLKFYPVVVICDRHLVKLSFGHHYRFDELLDSFVEVHGGRQNVFPHKFVFCDIFLLLHERIQSFHYSLFIGDEAFFGSIDHFVVDFVIFEKSCKRLMPSQVGTAESKEYLKGTKVLQFGNQFILLLLPKSWCAWDIV